MSDSFDELIAGAGLFDPRTGLSAWDVNQVAMLLAESSMLLQEFMSRWLLHSAIEFPDDAIGVVYSMRTLACELIPIMNMELDETDED